MGGVIRDKEIELRVNTFQDLIRENFGRDVKWEETKLTKTLLQGVRQASLQRSPGQTEGVITLSAGGQISWMWNMSKILFRYLKYKEAKDWYTLYQYPTAFRKAVDEGFFKPLLTDAQVAAMSTPGSFACGTLLKRKK